MPTYKGIPFNGGLDSPTGGGAANIVATLKAIIDFLQDCTTAGLLTDSLSQPSLNFELREFVNTAGEVTGNFQTMQLTEAATGSLSLDWNARTLHDAGSTTCLDWSQRQLLDEMGVIRLAWNNQLLTLPNLPVADPMVSGALWNNAGVLTLSP